MSPAEPDDITLLLKRMQDGDGDARARLISLVYPELRRMAARRMRGERPDTRCSRPRWSTRPSCGWPGPGTSSGRTASLLRARCGGHAERPGRFREAAPGREAREWRAGEGARRLGRRGRTNGPIWILDVDRLLARLRSLDALQAQVVEMRFFAGLTEREIADAMDVSERTIKRDWSMARAWMRKELSTQ